jgi:hypothetical protein
MSGSNCDSNSSYLGVLDGRQEKIRALPIMTAVGNDDFERHIWNGHEDQIRSHHPSVSFDVSKLAAFFQSTKSRYKQ